MRFSKLKYSTKNVDLCVRSKMYEENFLWSSEVGFSNATCKGEDKHNTLCSPMDNHFTASSDLD
jgi:hypothetical protein